MNQVQGIVVKVTETSLVLLCSNGTFKNVPLPENTIPLLGQPYTYIEKKRKNWHSFMRIASIASVFFVAVIIYFLMPFKQEAAYVIAIDINPSIEIVTDEKLSVIELRALNEDGQLVLNKIDQQEKDGIDVVEQVIDMSIEQGFLRAGKENEVMASFILLNESLESKEVDVEQAIQGKLKDKQMAADVSVTNDSKELYETAHNEKMSVHIFKREQAKEKEKTIPVQSDNNKQAPNSNSPKGIERKEEKDKEPKKKREEAEDKRNEEAEQRKQGNRQDNSQRSNSENNKRNEQEQTDSGKRWTESEERRDNDKGESERTHTPGKERDAEDSNPSGERESERPSDNED